MYNVMVKNKHREINLNEWKIIYTVILYSLNEVVYAI